MHAPHPKPLPDEPGCCVRLSRRTTTVPVWECTVWLGSIGIFAGTWMHPVAPTMEQLTASLALDPARWTQLPSAAA